MRFPSFPFNPHKTTPINPETKSPDKVGERTKAIQTLQARLKDDKNMSPEVRTATMTALLKLLENEITEGTGDLVVNQEMFHYSEPPKFSANDSNLNQEKRA